MSPHDTAVSVAGDSAPAPAPAPTPTPTPAPAAGSAPAAGPAPASGPPAAAGPGPDPAPDTAPEPNLKALGREALARAEHGPAGRAAPPAPQPDSDGNTAAETDDKKFDLARVAWLVTVLACLLTVTILVLQGYLGYAGVALAVALAAAINLL